MHGLIVLYLADAACCVMLTDSTWEVLVPANLQEIAGTWSARARWIQIWSGPGHSLWELRVIETPWARATKQVLQRLNYCSLYIEISISSIHTDHIHEVFLWGDERCISFLTAIIGRCRLKVVFLSVSWGLWTASSSMAQVRQGLS